MRKKSATAAEELWLLRLFVLIRAEKYPVSEADVISELDRRKIQWASPARVRRVIRSFVEKGFLHEENGGSRVFLPTALGKSAASEARIRLSQLVRMF